MREKQTYTRRRQWIRKTSKMRQLRRINHQRILIQIGWKKVDALQEEWLNSLEN